MLGRFSFRQKFQLLVLASLILGIFAYVFSIRKSFVAYSQYQHLKSSLEELKEAPNQISQLKSKLQGITQNFFNTNYDREVLFAKINTYCQENDLVLKQFSPLESQKEHDYEIVLNKVMLEGHYNDMLRLMYYLEYEKQLSHIASTQFLSALNRKNKKKVLTGTVYLQNIKAIKTNNHASVLH